MSSYVDLLNSYSLLDVGAKAASIAGLLFTIYAVIRIGQIRRAVLAKAMLPTLHGALRQHNSEISFCLNDLEGQWMRFRTALAHCEATLKALKRTGPKNVASDSKKLIKSMRKLNKPSQNWPQKEMSSREFYLSLVELESSLDYQVKESYWES